MRVILFSVKNSLEKLRKIVQVTRFHYRKKHKFLIQVSDEKSAKFVDNLLWEMPEESFLPHEITNSATKQCIAITNSKENVNEAKYVFNLWHSPLIFKPYKVIYDFEDGTSEYKRNLSIQRISGYKEANYSIESA